MQYLTTHDLVWVNNIVTGRVQPYNYVTLEACMAGQYAYGASGDVTTQAARLLDRLLTKASFAEGNRRTAFIATLAFLNANGYASQVADAEAARLVQSVAEGRITARQAVEDLAAPATSHLPMGLTLRKLITHECNMHQDALRLLSQNDDAALMIR